MTKRLLEECPRCGHDLGVAISRYFWSQLPGNDFEFVCPNCDSVLQVEVEPQPIFWVEIKVSAKE
jgi:hypothetical protein